MWTTYPNSSTDLCIAPKHQPTPFRVKPATFQDDFNLNVVGAVKAYKRTPLLQKSEQASIVFYSTVAVSTGMPFHASVAAAKEHWKDLLIFSGRICP